MLEEISLDLIDDSAFNVRMEYDQVDINALKASMRSIGLLTPVVVRKKQERYELVFGHRRTRAARALGWGKIKAELRECSNEQMLEFSLAENAARKDLSDFEKGTVFARMHHEYGKTYTEIGKLVGLTKQGVYHYVRMTTLFTAAIVADDETVRSSMRKISQHHARILFRIEDEKVRANTLKLVVSAGLSVKDLERIVNRLRSWFSPFQIPQEENKGQSSHDRRLSDLREIKKLVANDLSLFYREDHDTFIEVAYDQRYSVFGCFPPLRLYENDDALVHEKEWYAFASSRFESKLRGLKVRFWGDVAVATVSANYYYKKNKQVSIQARGSIVLAKEKDQWKIVHVHYSPSEDWDKYNQNKMSSLQSELKSPSAFYGR
ncbi:MAG: ParB/RepB/Spo0J family partition protein [Thaumarchaeota archaeon]|nr:ParB/RepB/Spo0J family partition protein [Nitrososphaerota archaeon]